MTGIIVVWRSVWAGEIVLNTGGISEFTSVDVYSSVLNRI